MPARPKRCAALLLAIEQRIKAGEQDAIATVVQEHAKAKRPVPGFGHGTHKPDDPRTARLFQIARERRARRRLCRAC